MDRIQLIDETGDIMYVSKDEWGEYHIQIENLTFVLSRNNKAKLIEFLTV